MKTLIYACFYRPDSMKNNFYKPKTSYFVKKIWLFAQITVPLHPKVDTKWCEQGF